MYFKTTEWQEIYEKTIIRLDASALYIWFHSKHIDWLHFHCFIRILRYAATCLEVISNVLWKGLSGSRQYIGSSKNTKTRRMILYFLMFLSSNWHYLWNKQLLALIFVVCDSEQHTNQQNKVLATLENLIAKCWKVNNWIIKYNLRSLNPTIIVQMTWHLV